MKLKHISFNCCLAASMILGGTVACTDDHYDVQSPENGGNTTESLWEVICKTPELSDFKEVCEKAVFYTDEVTPSKGGYTFKMLLDGNSQLTVFAPVNGSFDKDSLLQVMQANGYDVHNQFLANHIARFRYEVTGQGIKSMNMLNGKILPLDMTAKTLYGSGIKNANTPARNGVLHTMTATTPFSMNLYEYMRHNRNHYVGDFFCFGDTAYFLASSSVEGDIDPITGQMIYLDSVYYRSNVFFSSLWKAEYDIKDFYLPGTNARLNQEDSSYVAIIPSDKAYEDAMTLYSKLLRVAPVYADNASRDQATSATDTKRLQSVTDTMPANLSEILARTYLQKSLFYNLGNYMRKDISLTLDNFDQRKGDYLYYVSTSGDTLRNMPYAENRDITIPLECDSIGSEYEPSHVWNLMSMFDGKQPKRLSNGLVYEVDQLQLDPRIVVKRDVRIEGENSRYLYLTHVANADGGQGGLSITETNGMWERFNKPAEKDMKKYGRVSGGFGHSAGRAQTPIYVAYGLKGNIFAGKYDIYAVTVPYPMVKGDSTITIKNNGEATFEARLSCVTEDGPEGRQISKLPALVDERTGKTSFSMSINKVDTILLARDFEFPFCYVDQDDSWPVLQFKVNAVSYTDNIQKRPYLAIDFIYLKAKED